MNLLSLFYPLATPFILTSLFFSSDIAYPPIFNDDPLSFPSSDYLSETEEESTFILPEDTTFHASAPIEVNEFGRLPILEYHSIGPEEHRWTRSVANFKGDLEWLYNNDYFLLSIENYANNIFSVPHGKKPVVLTFDDGKRNHFNYLEDGTIDPDCAVGILDDFYKKHPDFGSAAVFYVNNNPFGQIDFVEEKIRYLHQTGRQIGYHTLYHADFRGRGVDYTLSVLRAQEEKLVDFLPDGMQMSTLAYPHGWSPAGDLSLLHPMVKVGLLIGARPAYPLYHEKSDAYRTPRIQAIDEEWLRHFGREPGEIEYSEKGEKFEVFVSDGVY